MRLFIALLVTALVVLKILGYVTASWLWILSPLWLPAALLVGLIGLCTIALKWLED